MMNDRIKALCDMTLKGDMYVTPIETQFDRMNVFLTKSERDVKELCKYIMNQEPVITEYQKMTGYFNFHESGSVIGDLFHFYGHKNNGELLRYFYRKPVDDLHVFEWQHATADYQEVLAIGLTGIIEKIDESLKCHFAREEQEYLLGLKKVANTFIAWCEKCSARVLAFSKAVADPAHRANLEKLSQTLLKVPANPPETFYEACLTIYVCFTAANDSVGTLDRYLSRFFFADLEAGRITRA